MTESPVIPKSVTPRSADYLSYIRSLRCCGCLSLNAEPHHAFGKKGTGLKSSDWTSVPMCRHCHNEIHARGREVWERQSGTDLYRVAFNCLHRFHTGQWVDLVMV